MMTMIPVLCFGLLVAAVTTFLAGVAGKRVTTVHWLVNLIAGGLGSLAVYQLLGNAYGFLIFGLPLLPMLIASLVLVAISSWIVNRLKN